MDPIIEEKCINEEVDKDFVARIQVRCIVYRVIVYHVKIHSA
jgi:hypothetical protein